jgi:hypothetical protein
LPLFPGPEARIAAMVCRSIWSSCWSGLVHFDVDNPEVEAVEHGMP